MKKQMWSLLFALIPNKIKDVYRADLNYSRVGVQLSHRMVNADFKVSVSSTLTEVFPASDIKRCYFLMK